jgi:cytoplasmic iron level regulating protein YaaA (DUF328/UPF0246 family)
LAGVFVLLPPSEGKADPRPGDTVAWDGLSFPALTRTRRRVLGELTKLCAGPPERALRVLGLRPTQSAALEVDRALADAGTLPAAEVYTGVLYDALGLRRLDVDARARAGTSVVIFSGLWGALRPDDRIPPYRLSMGVTLPRAGGLAALWREPLAGALTGYTAGRLILDLRSSQYAAAWRPAGDVADRTVTARVLRERTRTVVSHTNKAAKGRITRDLLISGEHPATAKDLADLLGDLGHRVELTPPTAPGRPWRLDVLVPDD